MSDTYAPCRLELLAPLRLPLVHPGDDLLRIILTGLNANGMTLIDGDVLVVAQKVVSKAEGRIVDLDEIVPTEEARRVASVVLKDARLIELVLRESKRIVRQAPNVLIVEHRLGFVMANAGVDQSNAAPGKAVLLPEDPDRSAVELVERIREATGGSVGVIISDSIGRAWRNGTVGHAIGVANLCPVMDLRGVGDLSDRPLQITEVAFADEIAAAASLLMGQAAEGRPVVIARGLPTLGPPGNSRALVRPKEMDLFR